MGVVSLAQPEVCWPWELRFMRGDEQHPVGAQCRYCRRDVAATGRLAVCLYCALDRGLVEAVDRPLYDTSPATTTTGD